MIGLAGAFCCYFPHVIEGYHPHRKGEDEILASIRWGGVLLAVIGALYTLAGGLNLQVEDPSCPKVHNFAVESFTFHLP